MRDSVCDVRTSSCNAPNDGPVGNTTRSRSRRELEWSRGRPRYLKFTEFQKANSPNFRGAFDLDKAEEWVKAMEVFSVLACTDYQKVAFATYMLEADAKFWWSGVKRLLESSQTEIIWEVFKEAFYQKYFPASVRKVKELEFVELQQGNMSVSEYIAKFEELCKSSTIYQRNADEN